MQVRPRDRFAAEVHLTPATVSAFAHNVGDLNPVHHDPDYAATTRYQRPIASGAHTTGLLMGLTATHFSQDTAMVGLEFWFRFRGLSLLMKLFAWNGSSSLSDPTPARRDIVDLRGRIPIRSGNRL